MDKKQPRKKTKTKKIIPFRVILSEHGEVSQIQFRSRQETLLRFPFMSLKSTKSPSNISTHSSNLPSSDRKLPNSLSDSQHRNLDKLQSLYWVSPTKKSFLLNEISRASVSDSQTLSRKATFSSAKVLEKPPKNAKLVKKTRFEIFDIETDLKSHHFSWSLITAHGDLPFASEYSQMVTLKTSLVLCGQNLGGSLEVKTLDLPSHTWQSLKLMKKISGKLGFSLTAFKSKLLVYGGYLVDANNRRHYSKKVVFVSSKSGKVNIHKGYGSVPKARKNHSACQLERFFVIFGGKLENNSYVSDFYAFNSVSFHWEKIEAAKSPSARSHGTLDAIFSDWPVSKHGFDRFHEVVSKVNVKNGGFFHFGGLDSSGNNLDELWCLRLQNERFVWTRVESRGQSPKSRYSHSSATFGHKLFIFGGRNNDNSGDSALDDLCVFDSVLVMWENIQISGFTPAPRWGHCMSSCNEEIFLFGGLNHKGIIPADLLCLKDVF